MGYGESGDPCAASRSSLVCRGSQPSSEASSHYDSGLRNVYFAVVSKKLPGLGTSRASEE